MQIHVRDAELTKALQAHVERRLHFALCRFGDRIKRVRVHLADDDCTGGQPGKRCLVEVTLRPPGNITVEEMEADLCTAIDRAAERAGRAVGREIENERVFDRTAVDPRRRRFR